MSSTSIFYILTASVLPNAYYYYDQLTLLDINKKNNETAEIH